MRRKNRFETYKEAQARGSYDEFPMLELGIDPQLHLSRNNLTQPFFLICEQDTVLAQMSGEARVEFKQSPVNYFDMVIGDFAYVPAGTPHRVVPKSESVQLRYKAADPGLEAVTWYSPKTGEEISRVTWDCAEELPQAGYLRACNAFNDNAKMRTCPTTGAVLPPVDLAQFRWSEIAAEVQDAETFETARLQKQGQVTARTKRNRREIVPPDDTRVPLKCNAYDYSRNVIATLSPMFPYFSEGCIVPCVVLQDLSDRGARGYFVHFNTVQEVNVCFGARGSSYLVPGGVSVGPMTHPVGDKPGQQVNPELMVVAVITQRQAVGASQHEAMIFMCEQCGEETFRHEYDADQFPDELNGGVDPQIIGLPTISQSARSAQLYNEDEHRRVCKKCGHANARFPDPYWGWDGYRRRTRVAVEAREMMRTASSIPSSAAATE